MAPLLARVMIQVETGGRSPDEWLQLVTFVLTRFTEAIAVVIIMVGVVAALVGWAREHLPRIRHLGQIEDVRLRLGRSLTLGLEFLLAADVLATAIAPTWEAIGKLAAIATIRTALNYFLHMELRREERRDATPGPPSGPRG